MFPLRATQHRHPLRHVNGPTVADYYEMIGLPSHPSDSLLTLYGPTPPRRGGERVSQVPDASLTACHALGPRQSLGNLTISIPLCWLPARSNRRRLHCCSYEAESLEGGTSPLRPTVFPVYASPVLFAPDRPGLRHRRNTRYGLLVRLCPIGTSFHKPREGHPIRSAKLRLAHQRH